METVIFGELHLKVLFSSFTCMKKCTKSGLRWQIEMDNGSRARESKNCQENQARKR
jgi:hypothetical protein